MVCSVTATVTILLTNASIVPRRPRQQGHRHSPHECGPAPQGGHQEACHPQALSHRLTASPAIYEDTAAHPFLHRRSPCTSAAPCTACGAGTSCGACTVCSASTCTASTCCGRHRQLGKPDGPNGDHATGEQSCARASACATRPLWLRSMHLGGMQQQIRTPHTS